MGFASRMLLVPCGGGGDFNCAIYWCKERKWCFSSYPFMASILAVFSYIMINAQAAQSYERLVAGLFSFAVFFYSLSLVLPKFNLFAAYTIAIICALIVQFISLRYIQRVPKKN